MNLAMAAPVILITDDENVAEEDPSIKYPIKPLADKNSASLKAELEAVTSKLQEVCLLKELAERMLQDKEEMLKQKDEELAMRELEQIKLQKHYQHLKKTKEFKPTLSFPIKESENLIDEKAKKKKFPNKPKKPRTPFILWSKDHREEVKAQHPEASFAEMSVLLGEKWKTLLDAEKEPYEEQYQKEKQEYAKLVGEEKRVTEGLKLLHEEQTQRTAMELMEQYIEYRKEAENNSKKTKRDPDKPKQAITTFFAFLRDHRDALAGEKYNVVEAAKMLGEEWKNMTDEMRAPYKQIALADKARYAQEMEVYRKKKAEEAMVTEKELKEAKKLEYLYGMPFLKEKDKVKEIKKEQRLQKKKRRQSRDPNEPQKPLSSYMMFSQECRSYIMPKASCLDIDNLVSARWKALNDAEKNIWSDKAAVAMERYKMEVEAYKKKHTRSPVQNSSASSFRPMKNIATNELIRYRSIAAAEVRTHDAVVSLSQENSVLPIEQSCGSEDHHGGNDQEVQIIDGLHGNDQEVQIIDGLHGNYQDVQIIDGLTFQFTSLTNLIESKLDELVDEVAVQDVHHVLEKMGFSAMDFWEGYKHYCIGYYAKSAKYQAKFFNCKMGHIIRRLYKEDKLRWNLHLDEKVRKAWFLMEEYVMKTERINCKDLESLIVKYDDPAKLATTEHGQFFLEICKSDGCSTPMPSFLVAR